jgi:HK97 family phage portal protein
MTMGFFDRIADRIADRIVAQRQTSEPEHVRQVSLFPSMAASGVFITEDIALSCPTAWACGSLIARSIAMLPKQVFAARGPEPEDGNQRLPNHEVEGLLHRQPNPEISAFSFAETMYLSALFNGNGYAEIERDNFGRPVALWPLASNRVSVCRDAESGGLEYEVHNGWGNVVTIPAEDMFHLAGPSISGPVGMSVIEYAKNTLGIAVAQERFAANFMRNQAAPSGMIKIKAGISDAGLKRLRAEVDQTLTGTRKAGKVLIGDSDWEWVPIGVSPQDAEFLAQRRFSVEEICRFFGVPPQLIGDTSKQTFANYEQAGLNFLGLAVLPWTVRFEQEANRKLFVQGRGKARPFLKINTAAIVRANIEAQYRAFALGRQWGWLSVNDIRRTLDMEPIGPEGDVYLQPSSMAPVPGGSADETAAEVRRRDEANRVGAKAAA